MCGGLVIGNMSNVSQTAPCTQVTWLNCLPCVSIRRLLGSAITVRRDIVGQMNSTVLTLMSMRNVPGFYYLDLVLAYTATEFQSGRCRRQWLYKWVKDQSWLDETNWTMIHNIIKVAEGSVIALHKYVYACYHRSRPRYDSWWKIYLMGGSLSLVPPWA